MHKDAEDHLGSSVKTLRWDEREGIGLQSGTGFSRESFASILSPYLIKSQISNQHTRADYFFDREVSVSRSVPFQSENWRATEDLGDIFWVKVANGRQISNFSFGCGRRTGGKDTSRCADA